MILKCLGTGSKGNCYLLSSENETLFYRGDFIGKENIRCMLRLKNVLV